MIDCPRKTKYSKCYLVLVRFGDTKYMQEFVAYDYILPIYVKNDRFNRLGINFIIDFYLVLYIMFLEEKIKREAAKGDSFRHIQCNN